MFSDVFSVYVVRVFSCFFGLTVSAPFYLFCVFFVSVALFLFS